MTDHSDHSSAVPVSERGSALDVVAEALWDRQNDLSFCEYYTGDGTCSFGCHDEPRCQTCEPSGGWESVRLRARYGDLIPAEDEWGAPGEFDVLAALSVLEALHSAGWRIVRLEECEDGPCDVGDEPDEYPQHIVEEWTPLPALGERSHAE